MKPGFIQCRYLVVVLGLVVLTLAPRCSSLYSSSVAAPTSVPQSLATGTPTGPVDTVVPPSTDAVTVWERPMGLLKTNWRAVGVAVIITVVIAAVLLAAVVLILVLGRRRRKGRQPEQAGVAARSRASTVPGGRGTAKLPQRPQEPCLMLLKGGHATHPIPLGAEGLTIGRADDNDFVIGKAIQGWESVSQHHARISYQDGRWILEDLGSRNGVYVNGRRTGRNLLRDGWLLSIGGVALSFHADSEEAT